MGGRATCKSTRHAADRRHAGRTARCAPQAAENIRPGQPAPPNRRHFDETQSTEWKRCTRLESQPRIAIGDVDFFKQFNDIYGHQAGDSCLRAVASSLNELLFRVENIVSHYGGEEFAAILPGTDASGTLATARRMPHSAYGLRIPHEKRTGGHVSCSLGIAPLQRRPTCIQPAARRGCQSLCREAGRPQQDWIPQTVRPHPASENIEHRASHSTSNQTTTSGQSCSKPQASYRQDSIRS
ncbi:diguanylate cyclase [Quatrionicoccus australiensis]|nr:diguanylate cyclase [Quatrionicoccus australiensis]